MHIHPKKNLCASTTRGLQQKLWTSHKHPSQVHNTIGISSKKILTSVDRAFNRKNYFQFIFAITVEIIMFAVIFLESKTKLWDLELSSYLATGTPLVQISCLLSVVLTELERGSMGGVFLLVATGRLYLDI